MYNPPRPRAPSAAALRVLYQLAYISSGTALGLGALCAEERRRRTKIVQKIADNAKRIRQHPKYRYSTSAAIVENDNLEAILPENHHLRQDAAFIDPHLPSVIDQAYDHSPSVRWRVPKILEEQKEGRRSRAASAELEKYDQDRKNHEVSRGRKRYEQESNPVSRGKRNTNISYGLGHEHAGLDHSGRLVTRSRTSHNDEFELKPRYKEMQSSESNTQASQTSSMTTFNSEKQVLPQALPMPLKFKTKPYWSHAEKLLPTLPELEEDVSYFYHSFSRDHFDGQTDRSVAIAVARSLLKLTSQCGLADDATALILWLVAVDTPNASDMALMARCYSLFVKRRTERQLPNAVDTTYPPLSFGIPSLHSHEKSDSQESAVSKNRSLFLAGYFSGQKSGLQWSKDHAEISTTFANLCDNMAQSGRWDASFYMMRTVPWNLNEASSIRNQFRFALRLGHLSLCKEMILWICDSSDASSIFMDDINSYMGLCASHQAFDLVRAIFSSGSDYSRNLDILQHEDLSASASLAICRAFAHQPKGTAIFTRCLSRLDDQERSHLASRIANDVASSLKETWENSRNLTKVNDQYTKKLNELNERHLGQFTRSVHLAMISINMAAGQHEKAHDAITKLTTEDDVDTYLLVMLAAVQQQQWNTVEVMLHLELPSKVPDQHNLRSQIVRYYAAQHNSDEVFEFAKCLHDKLDLHITRSVAGVVMQKFVVDERTDLFDAWFDLCWSREWELHLDADMVADILYTYSIATRVNHAMIMGTAHHIGKYEPLLINGKTKEVVQMVTDYDLRQYQRGSYRLKNVADRVRALHSSESGQIPHPEAVQRNSTKLSMPWRYPNKSFLRIGQSRREDLSQITGRHVSRSTLISGEDSSSNGVFQAAGRLPHGNRRFARAELDKVGDSNNSKGRPTKQDSLARLGGLASSTEHEDRSLGFRRASSQFVGMESWYDDYESDAVSDSTTSTFDRNTSGNMKQTSNLTLRTKMLSALTRNNYDEVLSLYTGLYGKSGFDQMHEELEIALFASLRRSDGDPTEAETLLSEAQRLGVDTNAASRPLLLHRIYATDRLTESAAQQLIEDVIEYYQLHASTDRRMRNDLAVTAANKLIEDHLAWDALTLLDAVDDIKRPDKLDPVTSSVWLKAYSAVSDLDGMRALVDRILSTNSRVSRALAKFLHTPRKTSPKVYSDTDFDRIYECHRLLHERRTEQMAATSAFLPKLAITLIKTHRELRRQHSVDEQKRLLQLPSRTPKTVKFRKIVDRQTFVDCDTSFEVLAKRLRKTKVRNADAKDYMPTGSQSLEVVA